jgi:hypothetical protein
MKVIHLKVETRVVGFSVALRVDVPGKEMNCENINNNNNNNNNSNILN